MNGYHDQFGFYRPCDSSGADRLVRLHFFSKTCVNFLVCLPEETKVKAPTGFGHIIGNAFSIFDSRLSMFTQASGANRLASKEAQSDAQTLLRRIHQSRSKKTTKTQGLLKL